MRALRPLRHRDFRLLWAGLAVSLVGDGVWLVALAWQVIELGGGPVQLSIVTTAFSVGLLVCVLIGGVVADRVSRRRVMLVADVVRGVAVVVLGLLSVSGLLEVWQLTLGGLVIGSAEAFFVPAFSALVPQLLPADELPAANGIKGVIRPLAVRAAGPALGGALVATAGPGPAMLFDSATYAVSVACLLAMRPVPVPVPKAAATTDDGDAPKAAGPTSRWTAARATVVSVAGEMREGGRYVLQQRWLWATLLFAMVSLLLFVGPMEVLLPFLVRDHAHGGASAYGLVLAAYGLGSAGGALLMASRPLPRRYLSTMLLLWSLGTLPFMALGWLTTVAPIAVVVVVVAASGSGGQVIWETLMQQRVPDHLLGRVTSLDWFVSLGLLPASMALSGPAGELLGLRAVFVIAGVLPVVVGLAVLYGLRLHRDELTHPLTPPTAGRDHR